MANKDKATEWKCKYCGSVVPAYRDICSTCGKKLKLVRKLLAMVRQAKERADNG